MSSIDFLSILGNLSQSLIPAQNLISGGSYLLGLLFCITALMKLMASSEKQGHEGGMSAALYFVFAAFLFYLPSATSALSNTFFGVGNVLTYAPFTQSSVYSSMQIIIRTAGLLWFVRGCVLVAQSGEHGSKHGPKGLVFIGAGILSMNFDNTIAMSNTALTHLLDWTISFKTN
jgi:hypothetical protein